MEEPLNYGHQHPLLLLNEDQLIVADCSRCGEKVSTPCFSCCAEACERVCAEAPLELNHHFHPHHPLLLMQNTPYLNGVYICDFCGKKDDNFVYHCSCGLDFHIKCALFTFNIAENNLKELEHVALQHPLISTENGDYVAVCFGCWEPLTNYTHFSPDCGFNLHEKYKCHQHTFTPLSRRVPYICDACGLEGIYIAYICSTCSIMVHKRCTTLPRIIKSRWHDHLLFHKYFLPDEFRSSDCTICHDEANPECGSYCCSHCNITFHVHCLTEERHSYSIVSLENEDEMPNESSISVIERNDAGEATKIKHFKHMHNLMLSPFVGGYENSCHGCMLPISDPFYYCSECGFFLHKACAELPKMMNIWYHYCQEPLALISDKVFKCPHCSNISNAFAYECCGCEEKKCLQCVIALTPGARTCLKHEHPLCFYRDYEGQCNACGFTTSWRGAFGFTTSWRGGAFCCKDCNFVLHLECFSLPITVHHKCDEHLLSLTDHDDNSYSKNHHCDICEESRRPNCWFYHCAKCDTSAHVGCILGKYPFLKLGSIYEEIGHPHPLTIVKKKYYYPDCDECGKLCEDVALECSKSECKYIVHWDCVVPWFLKRVYRWGL
ncbi:hypothetical protein E1A91_D02G017500v1 [Gossypium mustelinum]|uniref:Phorbol-ester/DAG-type domain-containing protein n=1 Tax=Gossypium mustelinum TaxID=34275 RepID=A0A5D2VQK9_GOSMU|nr:hypothetical protein E1A91_D02G017500v1 [Gossypium mustelinum]